MSDAHVRKKIWEGDRLGRQREADTIEQYLVREMAVFDRLGREQSIVLGIDSPYGRGKSWFLERLGKQLALSHPVARIDAWADDVGDEPLTAFMAAIDEALEPYLSVSKKLGDRMAAAKAAAFPVMGKLVSGALVKALTKLAGDEIEDQLGTTIEEAVRQAKDDSQAPNDHGAAAQAMEAAFDKLGEEIDSLVDRRGAAMLSAYRQRKQSREVFRKNMRALVAGIDESSGPGRAPLIVIIDELDRCRPVYALRLLEEIKHFFNVPGVVFIVALHGGQLGKSVKAVYGTEFESNEYLRRFFTRRYSLRSHHIVELAAAAFAELGIDESRFRYPDPVVGEGYALTKPRLIGLILADWDVTPREIDSVMDGLRLFVDGWEHAEFIEPIAALSLIVRHLRGEDINFLPLEPNGSQRFKGTSVKLPNADEETENFTIANYLDDLRSIAWVPLETAAKIRPGPNPAKNYIVEGLRTELQTRHSDWPGRQSLFADYIPRIYDLARFIEKLESGQAT